MGRLTHMFFASKERRVILEDENITICDKDGNEHMVILKVYLTDNKIYLYAYDTEKNIHHSYYLAQNILNKIHFPKLLNHVEMLIKENKVECCKHKDW